MGFNGDLMINGGFSFATVDYRRAMDVHGFWFKDIAKI